MRSYLVVGNQTLDSPELTTAIGELIAAGPTDIHVVVPVTPVQKGFTWDEGDARAVARERLEAMVGRLKAIGAGASGEIGSRDPIEAVHDALRNHPVDEIILSTLPPGISRWLGQDVPTRLRGSVLVPVTVVTSTKEPAKAAS